MYEILNWLKQHVDLDAHLRLDSRDIQKGDVFVACKGHKGDGKEFLTDAIENGASAILIEDNLDIVVLQTPVLVVKNLRQKLGELADAWYGSPSSKIAVIALTGTNGKTSCAHWISKALNSINIPCATIGTLGTILPSGENLGGSLTTPDVLSVHRILATLVARGIEIVTIEASSIGIEQGRLDSVQIKIAGFTNLTLDHLDYHKSMQEYEEAKTSLFLRDGLECAIFNLDDMAGVRMYEKSKASRNLGYSILSNSKAVITASELEFHDYGLSFNIQLPEGKSQVITRLAGRHNIYNLLLVAGVLSHLNVSVEKIVEIIATIRPVPGRLELVDIQPFSSSRLINLPHVYVDYSHTPDALANAIKALEVVKNIRGGKMACVFGCGGDRDKTKRPVMAKVASECADDIYITSDNPRTENASDILNDILKGAKKYSFSHIDRAYTILHAILNASKNDTILIAGKGHEDYQEINGVKHHFDDSHWAGIGLMLRAGYKINTDSRTLKSDEIFLAIKGENFDGHDFLETIDCIGAIVSKPNPKAKVRQFIVDDTTLAMGTIAKAWRSQFDIPVIAVCGSNGKTTCKEMIASILKSYAGDGAYFATRGNLNNHIGVPKSLLSLTDNHRIAVFELGMNHPGEIEYLSGLAKPTIAVVTNAQREHQEFMKSVEAVARENGSVFQSLDADGVAIYPRSSPYSYIWDEQSRHCKSITFGEAGSVNATNISYDSEGSSFTVDVESEKLNIHLSILGDHNIQNALAAIATTLSAGIDKKYIESGLAEFKAVKGRLQKHILKDGTVILDDTYNANPDSVIAAIDILKTLATPRTLVLGDMGEVGVDGVQMHEEIGAYARENGIDNLLTLGELTKFAQEKFGDNTHFNSHDELAKFLISLHSKSIIIKGSRFMKMEKVLEALTKD
ncbi:bifunctional UDP-N-acetylmuramoyl-L-alanyl-D-glutamate--2,6-diaminopimelate ligase MurE/UDP-N-acetylmuramoyl-tripeptide--D-alanyl-D-alanine ligase MurF [Taylorella equigenitalis]|uniref:bifunctional UDP-N-acetylmuramoyl-L-alanyl-D-glutamate--2, 6-diaminopimelate ligase MurE/UDP-N-acetylmuramoyl-tripeptide--D-alanyl-D-alanine ligase MurF n=1 Tax=Taylorella equigenitalis TaxID=29575 RepID=UPI0004009EB8|nr:bifunctional UDP-N-acetylmuramoyl-L-alanyl-D-glutamate--2,6-diaminopimelate ligase MurE/UDP-N-acetylmuramoyl-tripeptide--D-alanyl-D-alanine ligase MurF [Taylorella equigenitalis]WDU54557.1 bifunctional UDP-N-acetylmuramoyl-L-alanyl-D-glutamate--2,6-diaminopimelate ligase MurE/UDP-N-acetylmuramoyl-tripeptide--D-alanyl-D-alanine ligase MurF [Taylorella equigenitalis]